ncbi:putative oxidoreductase [Thermosporothrix hazakensis]|nr:putative oxidoreductase [Thermosporothrix hazakensis]
MPLQQRICKGASVTIMAAREQAELEQLTQKYQAERVLADVTKPEECEQVVDQTIQRFGHVDILVNNAGRGMKYVNPLFSDGVHTLLGDRTFCLANDYRHECQWTLLYDARSCDPAVLEQQREGSIINISMNYEGMKRRGFSPYGPSKAALESALAIWAQELIEARIRVNVLLPGGITRTGMLPVETPMDVVLSNQARLLQPEIMQAPAVFLASDDARKLTGRRLIAVEWSAAKPQGRAIVEEIGCPQ